jgi:sec-independent protein translocase protein TatA
MFGLGTKEIIIIAVVLVLLFGSKKIPELTKGIVDAIKHLRGAFKDDETTPTSSNNVSTTSTTSPIKKK